MAGEPVAAFLVGPFGRRLVAGGRRRRGFRLLARGGRLDLIARSRRRDRSVPARRRLFVARHGIEPLDEVGVVARRLALLRLDRAQDALDAIDGGENERDGRGGDRHPVAELAHQRLGGMRQRLQPGQSEKAAGAFDGVDEAKDVAEDLGVVRVLLEAHEFGVDPVETLVGLGQKLPQEVVHDTRPRRNTRAFGGARTDASPPSTRRRVLARAGTPSARADPSEFVAKEV